MSHDPRAEALCAAFLWWTAVLLVRVLLGGLVLGALTALTWGGQGEGLTVPLITGEAALSLVALWGGIWAALRPGGLELRPFWRQPWVLVLVAVTFLGASLMQLTIPTARAMLLGRGLPIEAFADSIQWSSGIGVVYALLHAVSLAAALIFLAFRMSPRLPAGVS